MRSERRGDFVLDRGAQFIASGYRNLHAVARARRPGRPRAPVARSDNAILRDGRLQPRRLRASPARCSRSRLLSAPAKARLPRLLFEVGAPPARARPAAPRARRRARSRGSRDRARSGWWATRPSSTCSRPRSRRPSTAIPRISRSPSRCSRCASSRAASASSASRAAWACSTQTLARERAGAHGLRGDRDRDRDGGRPRALPGARPREQRAGRRRGGGAARLAGGRRLPEAHARRARLLRAGALRARDDRASCCSTQAPATLALLRCRLPAPRGPRPLRPRRRPLEAGRRAAGRRPRERRAHRARRRAPLGRAATRRSSSCVLENLARTPIGRLRPVDAVVHRWSPMLPAVRRRLPAAPARASRPASSARRASPSPGTTWSAPTPRPRSRSGLRAATEIARGL